MAKEKENLKKGEVTRLAVEDAAIALFMEQGYHATSMRQIADRAGLALGGIYNHFTSKEEVFEAIVVDKHPYKRILPMVMETPGETAEEFLRNAFKITVNELGANPIYIKLMMIEMVEFSYAAQWTIQELSEDLGSSGPVQEEKVRRQLSEHFFDLEEAIKARPVRRLDTDLRAAIARRRQQEVALPQLPQKDCAACGAPGCAALAEDVIRGRAELTDCVFVRIDRLEEELRKLREGRDG